MLFKIVKFYIKFYVYYIKLFLLLDPHKHLAQKIYILDLH